MTSASPCAVYNFYNCCDPGSSSAGAASSGLFVWQSGNILDPYATLASTTEPLTPVVGVGTFPNASLKGSLGLFPVHRKAQLKDMALLRFADNVTGPPYPASISLDLVVLDFNGTLIRTISAAATNYKLVPLKTWTPISLTTAPGALDIMPGELVAGQLTFGSPMPAGSSITAMFQLSGTGQLMP